MAEVPFAGTMRETAPGNRRERPAQGAMFSYHLRFAVRPPTQIRSIRSSPFRSATVHPDGDMSSSSTFRDHAAPSASVTA